MSKTILLAAGGTGGHFFPAVAMAEELQSIPNFDVRLVTDNRCKKYLSQVNVKAHIIDLYINMSGLLGKVKSPLSFVSAIIKALILILRTRPVLIIGFGGYPTFPVMFIGQLFSIPTIIYEQNSYLGSSNKFFAKKAKFIATAYENTINLSPAYQNKTIITGDFVRKNIKKIGNNEHEQPHCEEMYGQAKSLQGDASLRRHGKIRKNNEYYSKSPEIASSHFVVPHNDENKSFTLLIIGGSQGAKFFSTLIPQTISLLLRKHPKIKINIIQQVTKEDAFKIRKLYDDLGVTNTISDFFHDIYKHYQKADLVVARSGATTIAELIQIGLPAIFIPYPYASNDHQYHNAKSLQNLEASWVYRQEEITPEILANKLFDLISNPSTIKETSVNLLKRKKDGTKNLLDTVLKIIA